MEAVMQSLDQQYAPMHLVPMITKHGSQEQANNAKDAELLTRERLCRALSMFEVVLQKMRASLKKDPVRLDILRKIYFSLSL